MGEHLTFPSNGGTCDGYLADGGGPGVIVIQEWWGLVPHIVDVTERFGDAGFTALAPDLYHGESATEPDGAGKLMMAMNLQQAAKDMSGAVDLLVERTGNDRVGVVGYCMGGGLALVLATQRPDDVQAVAPTTASSRGRRRSPTGASSTPRSSASTPSSTTSSRRSWRGELEATLRGLGKDVTMHVHEGADHAFFNDARPEIYAAEHSLEAWERTNELFREELTPPLTE